MRTRPSRAAPSCDHSVSTCTRRVWDCEINLGSRRLRTSRPSAEYQRTKEAYTTTLLQRFSATCLGRPAVPLVAEQMDLVAAGRLRIIKRDVGFHEQFGDPPA